MEKFKKNIQSNFNEWKDNIITTIIYNALITYNVY